MMLKANDLTTSLFFFERKPLSWQIYVLLNIQFLYQIVRPYAECLAGPKYVWTLNPTKKYLALKNHRSVFNWLLDTYRVRFDK